MTEDEKKEFEEFLEWKKAKAAQVAKEEQNQNQTPPPPPPPSMSNNVGKINHSPTSDKTPNGCFIVVIIVAIVFIIWGLSKCASSDSDSDASSGLAAADSAVSDLDSTAIDSMATAKIDTAARIEQLKHTVRIKSAYLSSPNSAGGVDAIVYYVNKSKKTIKYLTWEGCAINAVGDMVACDIRNNYYFRGQDTGPVKPGKTSGGTWSCAWYNWTAKKLRINQIDIEYMDGSTETITESEIKYVR